MDLSAQSLWEWTKLFVRDPRVAARLVKAANLPVEASVMLIVLSGVVSTLAGSLRYLVVGSPELIVHISEVEAMSFAPPGPIVQGLFAAIAGVGLAYAIFRVGQRSDGQGSLRDILAVTAVLQLVVTLIGVAEVVASLTLPILSFALTILTFYVFFRGLGHIVNEGHSYDNMRKSARVAAMSVLALLMGLFLFIVVLSMLGLTPQGDLVPYPQEVSL